MDSDIDLLQIKIDEARARLPKETRQAIDAVPWKLAILSLRAERGYSFTQLEDLEIETELLLCGLVSMKDYPKELEQRMAIPKAQVNELIEELNKKIFQKIHQELVKNIDKNRGNEAEKTSQKGEETDKTSFVSGASALKTSGDDLEHSTGEKNTVSESEKSPDSQIPASFTAPANAEKYDRPHANATGNISSILAQKLSEKFKMPVVETDHSFANLTKNRMLNEKEEEDGMKKSLNADDPYRESLQ